jgi:hypothetical protein
MTACHEPGNGTKPRCVRDSDFDRLYERLDIVEERAGILMAEVSATNKHAQAAYEIGRSTLNAVLELRSDMARENERHAREELIQNDRIKRLENYDDSLLASSSVTYSEEALRRRYEERKSEISGRQTRMQTLESRLSIESKAKAEALEAETVARARARAALWGAAGAIAMAVASAVVAALQTWR